MTGADLRPGAPGGTRPYVLGLARFLAARGLGVDILSNGPAAGVPDDCRVVPVSREFLPSSLRFQRALGRWGRRADTSEIGLFHAQRPDDLLVLPFEDGVPPAVCTLHGNPMKGIRRRRGPWLAWAYRRAERKAIRHVEALIAVDSDTARAYRRRYPGLADRIHVIPIAVDVDSFRYLGRESAPGDSLAGRVLLYAGRLSVEKRVDRIVDAVAHTAALSEATLVIAGTGPEEHRLRRIANGAKVRFLGNLAPDRMGTWYRRADALVLASEFEGLPTVALEALASGCPVVALAGCGLDDVLRGGRGILAQSPAELPEAIVSALRLRGSGTTIAIPPEFTWPSVGPRILEVYRTVAPEVVP